MKLERDIFEESSRCLGTPSSISDLVRILSRRCWAAWEANMIIRGFDPDSIRHFELRYLPGRSGEVTFQDYCDEEEFVSTFAVGEARNPEEWIGLAKKFEHKIPWVKPLQRDQKSLLRVPSVVRRFIEDKENHKSIQQRGGDAGNKVRLAGHVERAVNRLCKKQAYTKFDSGEWDKFWDLVQDHHYCPDYGHNGSTKFCRKKAQRS